MDKLANSSSVMDALELPLPAIETLQLFPGFYDAILHANALVVTRRRDLSTDRLSFRGKDANIRKRSLH